MRHGWTRSASPGLKMQDCARHACLLRRWRELKESLRSSWQEEGAYNLARADPFNHMRQTPVSDDGQSICIGGDARGFELGRHSSTPAPILTLSEIQHVLGDATNLGDQMCAISTRVGSIKAVDV